jgi:hypothetical protein
MRDDGLHLLGAFGADQTADLLFQRALHVVRVQHKADDLQQQDQQRRKRENGVVGQGRGHARALVFLELAQGLLELLDDFLHPVCACCSVCPHS